MKSYKYYLFFLLLPFIVTCSRNNEAEPVDLRVPVTVEQVAKGNIESYVTITGTLTAMEEAVIKAEVGGIIHFAMNNGNPVFIDGRVAKAGEILATLDNDEFSYNVRLELKKMAMDFAKSEEEKTKDLFEKGGATLREVQNAEKNKVDTELNYRAALLDLEKLRIKVPISGILADLKSIAEGDRIAAGLELGKVMNYKQVKCGLNVSNEDISKIRMGQRVKVTNYSLQEEIFYGRVGTISPNIDPITRTYQVDIIIGNDNEVLRPGMFVKADIIVESKNDVIIIPKFLLLERSGRDVVFIVEDQRAEMKEIGTGLEDDDNIEIISGLEEGQMLVTRGYETLKDKMKVRISR